MRFDYICKHAIYDTNKFFFRYNTSKFSFFKEPTVKSVTHALQMTEELSEFANYHGNEELSNTLFKVSDFLRDLKIREPQKQTWIDSYFFTNIRIVRLKMTII